MAGPRFALVRLSCLAALALVCCRASVAEDATAGNDPAAGMERIEVSPVTVTLRAARDTVQLLVTGYDADGRARDLTQVAEIRSHDESIATVQSGRVSAKGDGRTQMEIRIGRHRQSVGVEATNINRPDPIRFRSEVMPALTKQGCNAGSCHGAPEGKGGFALSMLAYKPPVDEESLTTGGLARRIEPLAPAESLLLKKPLLRVTHVGGKRLHPGDVAYRVLHDWIAEGARLEPPDAPRCVGIVVSPGPSRTVVAPHLNQQLRVVARFSDDTTRDVTRLAAYDSSNKEIATADADGLVSGHQRGLAAVTVRYLDFVQSVYFTVIRPVEGFAAAWPSPPENNYVDRWVHAKLKQLQFVPGEVCDDATFIRRVFLDLTGLPPTAERVRAFLADSAKNKRAQLIDTLLATEELARYWAQKEADLYRVNPQVLDADLMKSDAQRILEGRAALFNEWLVDEWRRNAPYDRHVRELLTAVGNTHQVGPSNFFEAIPKQDDVSEATAQLFMGSRINCAKCHNHPFESWTQDDYYRIVAVFTRVRQDRDEITLAAQGEATNPSTGKVMIPWGLEAVSKSAGKPDADRRAIFTEWLTQPDNPFFARVAVNRIWAQLLGRGIVHPVDDFRSSNPPTNPELLDALATDFASHGYDRKHVIRTIAGSRTYQLATATTKWNEDDQTLFSHFVPRRLSGEQLRDAIGYASRTLMPTETLPEEMQKSDGELAARLAAIAAEQPEWERKLHERLQHAPVWTGVWHSIGPFRAANAAEARANRFAPELGIDLEAEVDPRLLDSAGKPLEKQAKEIGPALRWSKQLAWIGGRDLMLETAGNTTQYFHTTLHVRDSGSAVLAVTTDAAIRFDLDGETQYDSDAKGKRQSATKEVSLKLSPGKHSLLFKITWPGGNKKLKALLTKWNDKPLERLDVRHDAVELLANEADSLPADLRAAVLAHRESNDPKVQQIRRAMEALRYRMAYHTQRPFPERSQFSEAFGQPKRETACACERSSDPTLDQALNLLNGDQTHAASVEGAKKYAALDDDALCEELYLSTLARRPSEAERTKIVAFLKRASNRSEAIRDLLWTLLNTQEFLFQH